MSSSETPSVASSCCERLGELRVRLELFSWSRDALRRRNADAKSAPAGHLVEERRVEVVGADGLGLRPFDAP